MEERSFNRLRYGCMAGCVIFGSGSSLMLKIIFQKYSYYPLFQSTIMFIGEFIASFFLLSSFCQRSKSGSYKSALMKQEETPKFFSKDGKIVYCGLSVLDLVSAWIENYCFNRMNTTDFLSLKMVSNYYILLYRIFIQKRKTYKHQHLGFIIFTLGILLIVIHNVIISSQDERTSYGIYIALMLLGEFFLGIQLILVEYFIWKNNASPTEINSLRGLTGLAICCLAYYPLIFMFGESSHIGNLETPYNDIFRDEVLCPIIICLIFDVCFYNLIIIYYIKITEALSFNGIDSGRILIVSMIFSFISRKDDEVSIAIQAIAGVCVFIGLIIYNEVLVIPFFGLDKSAKLSINENKILKQRRAENRTWIHKLDELVEFQNKTKELNNF